MPLSLTKKFLSFSQRIFFEELGDKFNVKSLKKTMDFLYVIFEKICIKFEIISKYYLDLYQELIDKEIKMAGISSVDTILVVGCGSLPTTSVLIAKKTNAIVKGVDIDPRAINNALFPVNIFVTIDGFFGATDSNTMSWLRIKYIKMF